MSRLIVKNLPKQITEEELKKNFEKKGNLTDVKLKYKNGVFRRFGFVGYENDEAANAACQFFNNTFIKQSKITVEVCENLGSESKPVSWTEKNKEKKKNAKTLALNDNEEPEQVKKKEKKHKKKKKDDSPTAKLPDEIKNDPDFEKFMSAGEKGVREKGVEKDGRDSAGNSDKSEDEEEEEEEEDSKLAKKKDISDQDYLKSLIKSKSNDKSDIEGKKKKQKEWKEFYTVVIRAEGMCKGKTKDESQRQRNFTKPAVKAFLRPLVPRSLRIPRQVRLVAYAGFKTEKEMKRVLQKDRSFLGGVRVHVMKYVKPLKDGEKEDKNDAPWSSTEDKVKNAEPVGESGKLFVRNLWYSVTEDLLREHFGQFGEVSEVDLPICKYSRRPKGFATITFLFPEHASAAMTQLDGTDFKGRLLHVLPAIEHENENKKEPKSFKEKKAEEKKATAGSWHNWNTLFMGSSAVVDIMAQKYNRSKQEILDSEGKQSVAVNLALGETQLVDETKRFLEDAGVSLAAFSAGTSVQRSRTVMLVKNLPAGTSAQELSQLFGRYGELGRLLLPPSGVTGLIEFQDAGEAKRAFKSLAYSRFKYLPLYLEWAPLAVFSTPCPPPKAKEQNTQEEDVTEKNVEKNKVKKDDSSVLPPPEPETTVYVKNLNFTTTEFVLKEHFESVGPVHSVMITRRRGLSQGYGFVQFQRASHARQALREINESSLEEHTLTIKLSEKTLAPEAKSSRQVHDAGKQNNSKILVKNIPFQATPKEVRQLFATFGELKTVRLPNKPGSTEHRGFGFVDFVANEDAKKAMDALSLSTHLYDRRLVLEWAREEETVEELRRKTAQHFLGSGPPTKKLKLALDSKQGTDAND